MRPVEACCKAPQAADLKRLVRQFPDFPKPGILFWDVMPLLADPAGLAMAVELMAQPFRGSQIDIVAGAESRGFIFGTAVANALSCGFVPIRKPGKLPGKTRRSEFALEYGTDALEIQEDAIQPGQKVLIVDDLLATGGTMKACCKLMEEADATIEAVVVLVELTELGGRAQLGDRLVYAVLPY